MHTSLRLTSTDFQFKRYIDGKPEPADFTDLFPHYHEQDRIAIISPSLEDGVMHTGAALLAITTAFYDILRSRLDDFFDYPQHFALIGAQDGRVMTRTGLQTLEQVAIGSPWGWLDVWPDTNWIKSKPTASGILEQVFRNQINRLFWPENLHPTNHEHRLPEYMHQMMSRRLKSVHYYNPTSPTMAIQASGQGIEIIKESIHRLSTCDPSDYPEIDDPYVEHYRYQAPEVFLERMAGCFET